MAEHDDQLVVGRGELQLAHEPLELRVVDVPVRGLLDDAALGERVDRDEAEARRLGRIPGVVAGGEARVGVLVLVHEPVSVGVALAVGCVFGLDLALVDEPPQRVGRHEHASAETATAARIGSSPVNDVVVPSALKQPMAMSSNAALPSWLPCTRRVVVSVRDIARDVEAGGRERQLRTVHEARIRGPVGPRGLRRVGVVEVWVRALVVVVVVLDAGVLRGLGEVGRGRAGTPRSSGWASGSQSAGFGAAAVRVERAALEQRPGPQDLVALHVVGLVAGEQREVHRRPAAVPLLHRARAREQVHLADRPVDDEGLERLLRAARGGREARWLLLGELDPRRRLLVGELEVGQLPEVGQRAAPVSRGRPGRPVSPGSPHRRRRARRGSR